MGSVIGMLKTGQGMYSQVGRRSGRCLVMARKPGSDFRKKDTCQEVRKTGQGGAISVHNKLKTTQD